MFLLKMGSGKTIDWVDTLSFIMSKNQKNYDFSIVIETLVRNLSHFFCHNKNQKERLSTESTNYLIRPCL